MAYRQRNFERLLGRRTKLAVRQEKIILELAEATRQMFHNVYILDEDEPANVSDLLVWRLDSFQHKGEAEHQEVIDGRKFTVVRKVLQSYNPDQRLMNVMDYRKSRLGTMEYILATNAGLLALSLAGGSIPEVLLREVMVRQPIGANRDEALDLESDLRLIPSVAFKCNVEHERCAALK